MQGALDRRAFTSSRWFALADLGCAAAGGVTCWLLPQAGPWPLALAALPWLVRLLGGQFPFRRTPLDFPIILFVFTALVGAWASYDRPAGTAKLWVLLGAVFLFYAIAGQPRANFWLICAFLSAAAAAISIYFLLTNDWRVIRPDLGFINRLAFAWMALRPKLYAPAPHPNIAGGLIALMAPFMLFLFFDAWKKGDFWQLQWNSQSRVRGVIARRSPPLEVGLMESISFHRGHRPKQSLTLQGKGTASSQRVLLAVTLLHLDKAIRRLLYTLATGGVAALGLLMSSSRAAWLALGLALGGWLLWGLCGFLVGGDPRRQRLIFASISILGLCAVIVLAARLPGGPEGLVNRLPGPDSAVSRLEIIRYSLHLVRDFPYTGGGLESFAGLFSRYIKVEPNFIFSYGHNLYLDLAIEQGLAGLASFLAILTITAWLLLSGKRGGGLRGVILAALVVMILHSLADDPLYANRGTPFLLLVPGMVVMATLRKAGARQKRYSLLKMVVLVSPLLATAILAYTFRRPLLSAWYADLGAVEMARVELVDFPSGQFDDGRRAAELAPAEAFFQKSLALDPDNVTANDRLGLAAMSRRDFPLAQSYLEKAYAADPGQRGVQKNLGYCEVWLGQLEQAGQTLQGIPEARREMEAYVSWWGMQGRPDLARWAEEMARALP